MGEQAGDVYQLVEDLIRILRRNGAAEFADILDHRMHRVAWTTGSELLDELRHVLRERSRAGGLSQNSETLIARTLAKIDSLLN